MIFTKVGVGTEKFRSTVQTFGSVGILAYTDSRWKTGIFYESRSSRRILIKKTNWKLKFTMNQLEYWEIEIILEDISG